MWRASEISVLVRSRDVATAQRVSGAGTMETTVFGVVKDVAIPSNRGPLFELRGLRCVRISRQLARAWRRGTRTRTPSLVLPA